MTRGVSHPEPTLSLDAARQIDRLCDAFEAAWLAGPAPKIEAFLLGAADDLRRELLRELIGIDLFYRRRNGDTLQTSDYSSRFAGIEKEWLATLISSTGSSRRGGRRSTVGNEITIDSANLPASNVPIGPASYFGDYELLEEIARGGMGVVFKARQMTLNRIVAVKMILAGQLASPSDVERFYAEAEAAANLDHPGIVPIFEVGHLQGQHYFSMGYVDGRSLSARVAEGPLSPNEAAQFMRTVCDAVQYAHEHQVIHRDLKPANILLDCDGNPRVTDFGLAKRVQDDSGLTATGQILGTPSFMPPEQAAGKLDEVGPASDVYALGAILYALLTGRPPFQAASSMDTLRQVLEQEPLSLRALTPGIPRDLETIALKCLEKSIPQRYSTARELADELQRFLDGRPILARPVSHVERGWRWCRRNPGAATLLTVSAGLLLIIAIVSSAAAILINGAKDDAVTAKNDAIQAKGVADAATSNAIVAKNDAVAAKGKALTLLDEKSKLAAEKSALANEMSKLAAEKSGLAGDMSKLAAEKSALAEAMSKLATERTDLAHALTREVFELGVSEQARGNTEAAIAILAQVHSAAAENSPLRKSAENLLGCLMESAPFCLPHEGAVNCVKYSPDGSTVVTASDDHTARVWDARTGRPVGEPLKHAGAIWEVTFSPDGSTVLTGSEDHTARLWNSRTGRPIGEPLQHEHSVQAVAYGPDGSTVLTGSEDDTARLWDARTGKPVGQLMRHAGSIRDVAYSPDGSTVLTGGADNVAQIWSARTGSPIGQPLQHNGPVVAVAYSPDGATVLTGSHDNTARLWDARTGKPVGQALRHPNKVLAVAYSPDGATVITASADHTAQLWNAKLAPIGKPMKHNGPILALAYSPDGATVVTGSADKTARLWNARTGEPIGEPMKHTGLVGAVAYSPDGVTVLTGGGVFDETARIWDARTEKRVGEPMRPGGTVLALAYSADGATVATGSSDGTARLWDPRTGNPNGQIMKNDGAVAVVVFSADGATVLTGSSSGRARLWDAHTGKPIGQAMRHEQPVRSAVYSRDGAIVVTGSDDHTARLWDARTGQPIGQPMKHEDAVLAVAISPDAATVLTGSADHTARLWDARSGQPTGQPMIHSDKISAVAFGPDGATVLTGSDDHTAQLWDAKTGKPIGQALKHGDKVVAVAYSPDAALVLTGSEDKTARLWDSHTREPVGDPMNHEWSVDSVAFSPDGATVLTGSGDTTARLWDAQSGKPLGAPMKHEDKVEAVAYSPAESTVLTASEKTARLWDVSRPIPSSLVGVAAAAHGGMRMSDSGRLERLSTKEFSEAWNQLEASGADWLAQQRHRDERRRAGWHRWQAAEAESKALGFAAAFHLKWLLSSDLANEELRQRLDRAKKASTWPQQADKPVGVQFNAWFYSADEKSLSGSFQKEGSGWAETKNGKIQARFKETVRTPDYIELFDEGEKRWVRLSLVESSLSSDHKAWTLLGRGSPVANQPNR